MSDIKQKNRKCGGGETPQMRPAWLKCPPILSEPTYPVPDGVEITPISEGGRNAQSKKKNKFQCGQCGVEAKVPEKVKPNISADCPMAKVGCPGIGSTEKPAAKGASIIDKIKSLFGKEDSRLVEACKKLGVEDEQIRHHRDVFNAELVCRKDGYFAPLFTKVDCQGKPDCTCGKEEQVFEDGEEDNEEVIEEGEYEEFCEDDDEYYEEEYEDEIGQMEASDALMEASEENMICKCTCISTDDTEVPLAEEEEEECVENAEGECVLEESAECMDPACKFFFEDQSSKQKKKLEPDDQWDSKSAEDQNKENCVAMNNFIIRVQSPFSETPTNETCAQIIARLSSQLPMYPEPGPRPEKDKEADKASTGKDVKLVVKQISVEEPSCVCPPQMSNDLKGPQGPPPPPVDDCNEPPPPPPADDCEPPPPPPVDDCNDAPPPFFNEQPPPPMPEEDECECSELPPPPPKCQCGCTPGSKQPEEKYSRPYPILQNDCTQLTEDELLKKPFRDIKCGCPSMKDSVWTPPPPPSCARCGASQRGDSDDCYLCYITRRMRSGSSEILDESGTCMVDMSKMKKVEPGPGPCDPEYLADGSLKYKGGMCMSLANQFLWHIFKRTPPGGFFDRYTGECGDEARLKALTGTNTFEEAVSACYSKRNEVPYEGGFSAKKCNRFLWGDGGKLNQEEEQEKRKCKPRTESENGAQRARDQCPAPPKY